MKKSQGVEYQPGVSGRYVRMVIIRVKVKNGSAVCQSKNVRFTPSLFPLPLVEEGAAFLQHLPVDTGHGAGECVPSSANRRHEGGRASPC